MFDRTMEAARAFKTSASSEINIHASTIFIVTITLFLITMIVYFSIQEKKKKLSSFKRKLEKVKISEEKKKKIFQHINQKYHGYTVPFFLFEKIAIESMEEAGVKDPKALFKKLKEIRKYS